MKALRVGALALVAAGALALPAAAAQAQQPEGITVVGVGTVRVVPDQAQMSFGVATEGSTARRAVAANAAAMRRVLAAIKGAGVAAADIRTESISVYPRTSEDGQRILGYTAQNTVTATIRALARAGAVIDAAVAAGANQVYGPTLTSSNAEELYEQALERAFDQARAKAVRLAARAGVTLGRVVAVVEGGGGSEPVTARADAEQGGGAVPIEPGTTEIQAVVAVTFAVQ